MEEDQCTFKVTIIIFKLHLLPQFIILNKYSCEAKDQIMLYKQGLPPPQKYVILGVKFFGDIFFSRQDFNSGVSWETFSVLSGFFARIVRNFCTARNLWGRNFWKMSGKNSGFFKFGPMGGITKVSYMLQMNFFHGLGM